MDSLHPQIITFGDVPMVEPEQARVAILSAPMEASVSYGHGTSLGPAAIIAASAAMELYDEVLAQETWEYGFLTSPAISMHGELACVLARISEAVSAELARDRFPVVLGGEHTITLGVLDALVKKYGTGFTVLSFDAHLDLREEYLGDPYSHACVMKRALDMGLDVRHLGVRSCSQEEVQLVKERGLAPMWAHQVHTDPGWLDKALQGLQGPVYISLDVDGFDPAYMPATGTPEPGGLDWYQLTNWLTAVTARCPVLGLDLVELAPMRYQAAWDFTAAKLLYRALGLILRGEVKCTKEI